MLWSCYPQLHCQHLRLFEYCKDQDYEKILDGDQCPLEVMKAWDEGTGYKFVVKLVKRPVVQHTAINEQIRCEENQSRILQHSFRKRDYLKTKKYNINCENKTSRLFSLTVDISIDGDTVGDTDSDGSELNISDEEEYPLKDESMSTSEEEDMLNNHSVIIDSFFT